MATNNKRKRTENNSTDLPDCKKEKPNNDTASNKSNQAGIFGTMEILVIEAGLGKTKAMLFRKQLTKNGAKTVDTFHSETTTHIIADESMKSKRICEILCIKEQPDIFKTQVLRTSWITACLKNKKLIATEDYLVDFSDTKDSRDTEIVGSIEGNPSTSTNSEIENKDKSASSQNKMPKTGVMWRANKKKKGDNADDNDGNDSDYVASDEEANTNSTTSNFEAEASHSKKSVAPGNWICAHSSANKRDNYNKHITDKLQELASVYESTNDKWRALGYQKAITALKGHPKPIASFEEAKSVYGVGAKLAEKIWEIVESGELRKLNELSDQEEVKALRLFTGIWGAGATTARAWVQAGFRTLDDIREKAHLTRQQKIGLGYYDDLLDRMSRPEAAEIEAKVIEAAHSINPGLICMACGSYRRGKVTCGDVDVLITHPDGKSHKGIFSKVLNALRESGFLTDDLVTQEDNGNQKKYLGVCKLPGENRKYRRLDIIVVPYDEYACALMYFTGSAHFNRSMRHLAGKMNMSLSEHSLNKGVVRVNHEKVNTGYPLPTPTEEDVFKHLGLKYRPAVERDH